MNKNSNAKPKFLNKYFYFLIIFSLVFFLLVGNIVRAAGPGFSPFGAPPSLTAAQEVDMWTGVIGQLEAAIKAEEVKALSPANIQVGNLSELRANLAIARANLKKAQDAIAAAKKVGFIQNLWDKAQEIAEENSGIAFKATLGTFLNNLAYDTATYLATGDWGQGPMFETRDFGQVLSDAGDNAAGAFLEALGKNGTIPFNLCTPDPRVFIKINLGLNQTLRPKKPACTFSQMTKNWDQALKDKDFLPKFQDMFNPWSNDLGIALTLQTGVENEISKASQNATEDLKLQGGLKRITDPISGDTKSPVQVLEAHLDAAIGAQTEKEKVFTGTIGDAIGIFINTLAGKLMDQWLKKGLVTNFPEVANKLDNFPGSLTDPNAALQTEGISGAKDRLKSIIEPNFASRADYNILDELVTCPNPSKVGPTNCVIDEKFRQAIAKRLTVGQALSEGYLNANGIFGFISSGLEPKYNEGYPYRSMLILRKFRIIPVGWEIAAQKIKDQQDLIKGTKNLNDLINCFSGSDDYGVKGSVDVWCAGLVDPDWVLKAPQNFCKKQGPGPIITSEQVVGQGDDASLTISRDENYCADEQSVITEKSDGSPIYGYCTEERRTWDFNAKSCEPRNNTCRTFGSSAGQSVSYLENTLDFSNCNPNNAGCQAYCQKYDYAAGKFTCTINSANDKIYLNKQAESCEAEGEGCHQLIRLNAGGGANLLVNSGFEDDLAESGWSGFGGERTADAAFQGSFGLKMNNPSGVKNREVEVGSADYNIAGESYTLSFYAKNCASTDKIFFEEKSAEISASSDWIRPELTYTYPSDASTNKVKFSINSGACLIDNIKLEKATAATKYSGYGAGPSLIYEKLLPGYLADACYIDSGDRYVLKDSAPAVCLNYARQCKKEEAGCELYTGVLNEAKIPAKVIAQDYCPAECVGYNTFVQSETAFDSKRDAYFIPKTAKTCSADASGCDQFTNLDEVAKGGEGIEYYSYLRQCLKKNDPPAGGQSSCAEFYSWEGSDESGFQLKVESLKTSGGVEPDLSSSDAGQCSLEIYNLPPSDPRYRADCRQFYNRAGGISYHLYSHTIACSDDCHPYRRTALNIDDNLTSADCTGIDKHWDTVNYQCVVCKNGGVWNNESNYCIYQAIPNQGTVCSASQNGCREYIGNTGNNVRNIFTDDFKDGTTGAWQGVGGTTVEASSQAVTLGPDNKGHSIKISGGNFTALRSVYGAVSQGQSYVLNFVAKAAAGNSDLTFSFKNASAEEAKFAPVHLTGNWQVYTTNLENLSHEATSSEILLATDTAGGGFFINNITLTEIVDRFYLYKDSWRTPDSCDSDEAGNPYPLFMLGCEQYSDRAGKIHNLKQFNKLCSESAVGCEPMIDTKNSTSPYKQDFTNSNTTITVPKDSYTYIAYDQEKLCNQADKGCERLGQPYKYDGVTLYGDAYLKNDPDKYDKGILCGSGAVGCQAYSYDGGEKYFKDPGDQVCEYRQKAVAGNTWQWYKKKVKRCDLDGNKKIDSAEDYITVGSNKTANICLSDNDCVTGHTCLLDENDRDCPISDNKTFGLGGVGNKISQPAGGWAGVCQANDSGCGEYIDPVSKFNTNLLFNGNFQDLDNNPATVDGWSGLTQKVILDGYTLYRLVGNANTVSISNCTYKDSSNQTVPATIKYLTNENKLENNPSTNGDRLFYLDTGGNSGTVDCLVTAGSSNTNSSVELKPAVINYQLSQNLDRESCNGLVNFSQGCVLFNERKQDGADLAKLTWDADSTDDGSQPATGATGSQDSNIIIKVAPDRVCDKWLSCRSYVKDQKGNNVCFDIGLCDAVDDNGNCKNLVTQPKVNQLVGVTNGLDAAKISNLSGYAKAGITGGSLAGDYYPLSRMEQTDGKAGLINGGFEFYGDNGYPVGWQMQASSSASVAWTGNQMRVISSPVAVQAENVNYVPEGKSFLKIGATYKAVSENIEVMPGAQYILTGYINTKRLSSGRARIFVGNSVYVKPHAAGPAAGVQPISSVTLDKNSDWTFKLMKFNAPASGLIKITLWADKGSDNQVVGNFYFDDIKLVPALESKTNWYTPQSCRLYPKDDSLSCDYYEDSGSRQKGWYGYCLEYDRAPGDPNACLLWYPVDKVSGDGVEEVSGYRDRAPLYYCQAASFNRPVERRKIINKGTNKVQGMCGGSCASYNVACPPGYEKVATVTKAGKCPTSGKSGLFGIPWLGGRKGSVGDPSECEISCNASGHKYLNADSTEYGWYDYTYDIMFDTIIDMNGANIRIPAESGMSFYDANNGKVSDSFGYCRDIVQVVTPAGQNKYWSGRVYENSDYIVKPFPQYNYSTYFRPFGSALPPAPSANPYEWSGASGQPLPITNEQGLASAGMPYSIDNANVIFPNVRIGFCQSSKRACLTKSNPTSATTTIDSKYACQADEGDCEAFNSLGFDANSAKEAIKRLFAKNYGTWEWNDGAKKYIATDNISVRKDTCTLGSSTSCYVGECKIDLPNGGVEQRDCVANENPKINFCVGGSEPGLGCTSNCSDAGKCEQEQKIIEDWTCSQDCPLPEPRTPEIQMNRAPQGLGGYFTSAASFFAPTAYAAPDPNRVGQCGDPSGQLCCDGASAAISSCGVGKCVVRNDGLFKCLNTGNIDTTSDDTYCDPDPSGGSNGSVCTDGTGKGRIVDNPQCGVGSFCNGYAGGNITVDFFRCQENLTNTTGQANFCCPGGGTCITAENKPLFVCKNTDIACSQCQGKGHCTAGEITPSDSNNGWTTPTTACTGPGNPPTRPDYPNDYCAVPPIISNIQVSSSTDAVIVANNNFVKFTFTTKVDPNQLPLVRYAVDWRDGTKTVVSGVEMRDRPTLDNPHLLYHLYSYWDLKAKAANSAFDIDCSVAGECRVKPKIQIKDNWGWCNGGQTNSICPTDNWVLFGGTIVVKEK